MLWKDQGRDPNIEDQRGASGGGMAGAFGGRSLGLGGTVVLLVLSLVFGRNFFDDTGAAPVVSQQQAPGAGGGLSATDSAREEPEVRFLSFVLRDIQQTWTTILPQYGAQYHDAHLVLYRDAWQTGCGTGQSGMGPFYCPVDQKVYLDLAFFEELANKFKASGDFAQAYVVAHEVGHHVQHILGTDAKVRRAEQQNPGSANGYSVALELQADCFAGVWAHATEQKRILEKNDIEEGLNAASAVGDDRIQSRTTGSVHPETFTHGTSAQRASWFRKGLETGDPRACDTFK